MEQTNVLFCCIVHFICAESLTQWIWKYKAILCVMSTFYLFMLCDFSFFFMKVPFSPSCSTLGTYSIPHSLLLYSVHVKWILICVQNVIKMKIHLIIYFVHPCRVWWFISIYGDFDIWKTGLKAWFPPHTPGQPAAVQSKHQNGEERWFKWFWVLHGFFGCQTCGSEYFRNCWSSGIFRHSRLPFAQSGLKTGGYVVGSSSLGKISRPCQWPKEKGQTQGSS